MFYAIVNVNYQFEISELKNVREFGEPKQFMP